MSENITIKSKLKEYKVVFVDDFMDTLGTKANDNSFIVIDQKVLQFYKDRINKMRDRCRIIPVRAIEQNKTLEYCRELIGVLISNNIRKNSTLIAVGGGIIQDITAFVSSIIFRGIDWKFYPTTLLAQADSCIGSKTSINYGKYKNLLGNFYPPKEIYIDLNFLNSLSAADIKSGIGEILHYFFIDGKQWPKIMMDEYESLLERPELLKKYILKSLSIKKKIIEKDEYDRTIRNIFNYGHTFGHAIEAISNFKISHGQAVTMGMDMANYISLRLGYLDNSTYEQMRNTLIKNMPAFKLQEKNIGAYMKALSKDKKNIGNNLGCILTSGPGSMKKVQIPMNDKMKSMISSYFKGIH